MTTQTNSWNDFVSDLPSQNPYNHKFSVVNWFLRQSSSRIRNLGLFAFLDSVQSLTVIIAVIVFAIDLSDRRVEREIRIEERNARTSTAVFNAYSVIAEILQRSEISDIRTVPSRYQMLALEELHKYSEVGDQDYLANLVATNIQFSLPRSNYYDGCEPAVDSKRIVLKNANFDRATLTNTTFVVSDLSDARFDFAVMTDIDLYFACLRRAIIVEADLTGARLQKANLAGAVLKRAKLTRANVSYANLAGANLTDADLSDASLIYSRRYRCQLFRN